MADTMLMTIGAGVVRITREGPDEVIFRFTGERCSLELVLTAEEGGSLGAALNQWSGPRHHPARDNPPREDETVPAPQAPSAPKCE